MEVNDNLSNFANLIIILDMATLIWAWRHQAITQPELTNHQRDHVHSYEGIFIENSVKIFPWYAFENYLFMIVAASPEGQWIKNGKMLWQYSNLENTYAGIDEESGSSTNKK